MYVLPNRFLMIASNLDTNGEYKPLHTVDAEKTAKIRKSTAPVVEAVVSSLPPSLASSLRLFLASPFLLANMSENKLYELRTNFMTPFLHCKMLLMIHFHLKTLLTDLLILLICNF